MWLWRLNSIPEFISRLLCFVGSHQEVLEDALDTAQTLVLLCLVFSSRLAVCVHAVTPIDVWLQALVGYATVKEQEFQHQSLDLSLWIVTAEFHLENWKEEITIYSG